MSFHVPEFVAGSVRLRWYTALVIEMSTVQLKRDYEHFSGVWSAEKTLAFRSALRAFVAQVLNPALDAAAAGFSAGAAARVQSSAAAVGAAAAAGTAGLTAARRRFLL